MTQASDPRRLSPLAHRGAQGTDDHAIAIAERPFQGKLILRGQSERIGSLAAGVLGAELPTAAGGVAMTGKLETQWLGPDEWLLVTAPGEETPLLSSLAAALAGHRHQLVDVTDNYTTIHLTGTRAREVLMKVATVDLHPRAFVVGQGVASNFGRVIVFARLRSELPVPHGEGELPRTSADFDLVVRSSMADYLWCLLCEAGHEWGLLELDPRGIVRQHLPHWEERP